MHSHSPMEKQQMVNDRYHCWISEAAEIRKQAQRTVNREEGKYMLSHTLDTIPHKLSDNRGQSCPTTSGSTTKPV